MQNTRYYYAAAAVIIIALLTSYYGLKPRGNTSGFLATESASSTSVTIDPNATSTTVGGYTIERVDVGAVSSASYPEINRPIPPNAGSVTGETRTAMLTNLGKTAQSLAAQPGDLSAWMILGVYREMLGDYEGARQAWEYVIQKLPSEPQAYANLGDLYQSHLHDLAKAEGYFTQAVAKGPTNPDYYRSLAEVQSAEGKTSAAEATLKAGFAAVPKAIDLEVLLAHLYRDAGDTTSAKAAYQTALTAAKAAGNTSLAAFINEELSTLK